MSLKVLFSNKKEATRITTKKIKKYKEATRHSGLLSTTNRQPSPPKQKSCLQAPIHLMHRLSAPSTDNFWGIGQNLHPKGITSLYNRRPFYLILTSKLARSGRLEILSSSTKCYRGRWVKCEGKAKLLTKAINDISFLPISSKIILKTILPGWYS